jgi:hypothetical protein
MSQSRVGLLTRGVGTLSTHVPYDEKPLTRGLSPYPQVWDRERVIIIPDHYIFTSDPRANRNVDLLREFVQEQDIK